MTSGTESTNKSASPAEWIAADWGTSHLRVWVMGKGAQVLARLSSDKGMGKLTPTEFEPVLLDLLADYLSDDAVLPVVCCGMAGARQGWVEAPYAAVPCPPPSSETGCKVDVRDPRISVSILPGIKQLEPADVMRGEETQIAGVIAQKPDFAGVICLPGTHTKWVAVKDGIVTGFSTIMSGELFALLGTQSVLRHSVGADGWQQDSFEAAVREVCDDPAAFARVLFSVRAQSLVSDLSPEAARSRLSGLLIGLELAASRTYWSSGDVVIVGADALADAYAAALKLNGIEAQKAEAEELTLNGLKAAYSKGIGTDQ
ncbi:MAG: 2-dehydro-3-deoxygalactonokinase [Rhodobacteraceae bacterium]|nr:2-dehydro-3-deoxygalactonokinase [Paracoccaceae bacterium]